MAETIIQLSSVNLLQSSVSVIVTLLHQIAIVAFLHRIIGFVTILYDQKRVSAKQEFKKNRDGMGFMIEGDVRSLPYQSYHILSYQSYHISSYHILSHINLITSC